MADFESLREQVQARRKALQANKTITLDVPGSEGILQVRCRALDDWAERRKVAARSARDAPDEYTLEVYQAADTLVAACDSVLDVKGEELGKWSVQLAADLGYPDQTSPRTAIIAICQETGWLAELYNSYEAWYDGLRRLVDDDLLGESGPLQPSA